MYLKWFTKCNKCIHLFFNVNKWANVYKMYPTIYWLYSEWFDNFLFEMWFIVTLDSAQKACLDYFLFVYLDLCLMSVG